MQPWSPDGSVDASKDTNSPLQRPLLAHETTPSATAAAKGNASDLAELFATACEARLEGLRQSSMQLKVRNWDHEQGTSQIVATPLTCADATYYAYFFDCDVNGPLASGSLLVQVKANLTKPDAARCYSQVRPLGFQHCTTEGRDARKG
jgi:hypothetical protein